MKKQKHLANFPTRPQSIMFIIFRSVKKTNKKNNNKKKKKKKKKKKQVFFFCFFFFYYMKGQKDFVFLRRFFQFNQKLYLYSAYAAVSRCTEIFKFMIN